MSEQTRALCETVSLRQLVLDHREDAQRQDGSITVACPLHEDKAQSVRVESEDRFHCTACGAVGGVIEWMRYEHDLSFPEAVTRLKRWCQAHESTG
jgi:DNA primase